LDRKIKHWNILVVPGKRILEFYVHTSARYSDFKSLIYNFLQVYVDMQKIDRYPHKIKELYEAIKKKAVSKKKVSV